ncbi:MAG: protein-methionine-sulfoxide reductase catalytic subunit MsrP [Methylococcaceae bacterium]
MIIKTKKEIPSSEITDYTVFKQRREIIKGLMALTGASILPTSLANTEQTNQITATPAKLIKNYTNYYEFTLNKEDSTQLAQALKIEPWSVEISGEVEKPALYHLEDLLAKQIIQQRLYRFRCVEAWSMVVPWQGFVLAELLKQVKPLSTAKFVKFTSVYQPDTMPNQKNNVMLQWPYTESLRLDEAMHPLTLLATGMYDETLPKQNGAPLRLIVPWKYGFKSIKAIVKIELLKNPPLTTWNQLAPTEYGFYANVNPDVAHPRWSQNSERLLGSGFFTPRRQTELFNGYGEQVASLYSNMDLRHFF